MSIDPKEGLNDWHSWNYEIFIRMDAAENVEGLYADFLKKFDFAVIGDEKFTENDMTCRFMALPEIHFTTDVAYDGTSKSSRQTMLILLAIAFVIVAIAGINFTNFSTSLAPKRIRSINTQRVLGGSAGLIRMALVIEGVAISLLSFLLGLGLVHLMRDTPLASLMEVDVSLLLHTGLIAATAGLAVLTGLLAGLYPSYYVTSFQPAMVLKGSFGLSLKGRQLRNVLISVQFIASFTLIIGASFMYLQYYYMHHTPLGYDKDELIITDLSNKAADNREAIADQLKSLAGIADVVYAETLLSSSDQYMGWGKDYHDRRISFQCLPVEPSFLRVMGIAIAEGRDFREEDTHTRHGTFIFNEKARDQYNLALNEHIDSIEIVGFMADVKFASFRSAVEPMAFYVWGTQNWGNRPGWGYIKVKAGADLRATIAQLRTTLTTFDDTYPFQVRFFDEVLNNLYEKEQKLSSLITLFSLVAILISIVGVFGLVIFDSEYRRKEISIRKVFGSTTTEILILFNKGYVRILALCFLLAAPLAYYGISRWLENFAYKTPLHWWIFAAAFASVFVLTVGTVTFQNWRAANKNPIMNYEL
jgi:putative ABC transport system permease protein